MSTILAIETSTTLASVALLHEGNVLVRESAGTATHSETVLHMVQQLLADAEITFARCDAIGFGMGPGSFTGVRTACGVVQGLAFGAGLPVVPVNTLEAMALACRDLLPFADTSSIVPVLDARMGEVYWGQYCQHGGKWQEARESTIGQAHEIHPEGDVVVCGNGIAAYPDAFAGKDWVTSLFPAVMPHAREVARLAAAVFAAGDAVAAEQAQPLYLRNKVALTTAERAVRDAAKGAA